MWLESFRLGAEYNRWCNCKVYAVVSRLGEDELKGKRTMFGESVDGLLHHVLIADGLTMQTLACDPSGFRPKNRLGQEIQIESMVHCLYREFADLKVARQHLDREMIDYVSTLSEEELLEPLVYFDANGEHHKLFRWQLLAELSGHQLHHRGQLSAVLHGMGFSTGSLDYSLFLQQSGSQKLSA